MAKRRAGDKRDGPRTKPLRVARPASTPLPDLSSETPAETGEPPRFMPRSRFTPLHQVMGGRYRVDAAIGSGGMGTVYAAVDLETGEDVAIKVLNAESFTASNLRRFRREAQTATAVRHRRVCAVHFLGVEQEVPYIVMERLEGETLRRRMRDTGALSAGDALTAMLQVCDALTAAHAVGVLHRDIKPGNIFVTSPRGAPPQVKVIDFGLAKIMGSSHARPAARPEEHSRITTTDVIPGTPFYLSPEQIAGIRDLDHRVDLWAAGLTLYEMLLGRRAYVAASYPELARSIMLNTLPPISSFRADIPEALDDVLAKALAKRREERFQSAGELRDALIGVWARHRAAAVARGERLRKFRPEAKTLAEVDVDDLEMTDIDVSVEFDP